MAVGDYWGADIGWEIPPSGIPGSLSWNWNGIRPSDGHTVASAGYGDSVALQLYYHGTASTSNAYLMQVSGTVYYREGETSVPTYLFVGNNDAVLYGPSGTLSTTSTVQQLTATGGNLTFAYYAQGDSFGYSGYFQVPGTIFKNPQFFSTTPGDPYTVEFIEQ